MLGMGGIKLGRFPVIDRRRKIASSREKNKLNYLYFLSHNTLTLFKWVLTKVFDPCQINFDKLWRKNWKMYSKAKMYLALEVREISQHAQIRDQGSAEQRSVQTLDRTAKSHLVLIMT